jgi:integrase
MLKDATRTTIYRRHLAPLDGKARCKNPSHCKCPLWLYGYVKGERIRESLNTCDMEIAVDRQRRREGRLPMAAPVADEPPVKKNLIADETKKYLVWCEINNGVSDGTLKNYRLTFRILENFCKRRDVAAINEITHEVMRDFVTDTLACYKANSRATYYQNLKSFFNYLLREVRLIKESPMMFKGPRRPGEGTHRPLSEAEQEKILKAASDENVFGRKKGDANRIARRDRAIVLALLSTGLRATDVRRLTRANLDLKKRELRIVPQKTKKTRREVVIPNLPQVLIDAIQALPHPIDKDEPIFGRMSAQRFYMTLKAIAKRSGVSFTAHDCRVTFAVGLLTNGVSIYDVSKLLGHSSVTITERYYIKWIKALDDRLVTAMGKADFSHLEKAG